MTDSLRRELLDLLEQGGIGTADELDGSVSLILSGRLDSVALFNLSLWVEEKIGRPVDPAAIDLMQAWDTVDSILAFVAASGAPAGGAPAAAAAAIATVAPPTPQPQPPPPRPQAARDGIEIVRYAPSMLDDVLRLQQRLWSPDPALNRRFFAWRYEDNPFDHAPLVYLARRDGRTIGMRGLVRSRWQTVDGEVDWYSADDLAVESSEEGHGLFARFRNAARDDLLARGAPLLLSLSALRVTRLQSLAAGARSLGVVEPLGRLSERARRSDRWSDRVRALPLAWRLADRLPLGTDAEAAFGRLDRQPAAAVGDLTLDVAATADAEAMAALIASAPYDGRIRQLRDRVYLAWRYRNPLHAYRFVRARRGAALVGYLVLQRGLSPYANRRRVNVADWEAPDPAVLRAMLRFALEAGALPEVVTWGATLDSGQRQALAANGFGAVDREQTERGLPCVLLVDVTQDQGLRPQYERLASLAYWDLRMAYTSLA